MEPRTSKRDELASEVKAVVSILKGREPAIHLGANVNKRQESCKGQARGYYLRELSISSIRRVGQLLGHLPWHWYRRWAAKTMFT